MKSSALLSEKMYLDIKEKIVFGQYLPGVHLVEAELIEAYSLSRTTVREALRRLIEDELVELIPHKGVIVRKLSEEDAENYYQITRALEVMVASKVALNRTEEQLDELEKKLAEDKAAVENDDFVGHLKAIHGFRSLLTSYTENQPLLKLLQKIQVILTVFHITHPLNKRMNDSHERHRILLEAIRRRDARLAEETMKAIAHPRWDYSD